MADRLPFRPRAYSPEDVAALWSCSPEHVRKLCRTGALPFWRLGGKLIRIKIKDVEALEERFRSSGQE